MAHRIDVRILAPGCGQLEVAIFSRDKALPWYRVILCHANHDHYLLACFLRVKPHRRLSFVSSRTGRILNRYCTSKFGQRIWLGSSCRAYHRRSCRN